MLRKILRKFWIHLSIALNENYTLEGFEKTQRKFELPEDIGLLDPNSKRQMTICNLFANQHQSLGNIARLLDADYGEVVVTLINQGLIKERRRNPTGKKEGLQRPLKA